MFLESSWVTQTSVCTDHQWQHCCLDSLRLLYLLIHLLLFPNLFLDVVTWKIFVHHHLLLLLLSHQNMDVYPLSLDLEVLGHFSLFFLLPLVESFWPWTTSPHVFHVRCTCLHLPPECHLLHCLKGIFAPSASASVDLLLSTNVCVVMNHASCCCLSIWTQTHF